MKRTKVISLAEYLIDFVGIIAALFLITRNLNDVNNAVIFATFFLLVSTVFNLFYKLRTKETSVKLGMKTFVSAAVLSALFLIQISFLEIADASFAHGFFTLIILGILFLVFFQTFCFILSMISREHSKAERKGLTEQGIVWGCRMAVLVEAILFLVTTYPGIWITNDVANVYRNVINGEWNDWHTLGYQLFVKMCLGFFDSTFAVNVVQTIAWVLILFYAMRVLNSVSRRAMIVFSVVICVILTPASYLQVMYKDVVFSMGILALTVVVFKILYFEVMDNVDLAMMITMPLFALLCRHGGVAPVLLCDLAIIGFALYNKNRKLLKKIIPAVAWHLLSFLLVNVVLMNALDAERNPSYIKYGTPMAMIGAAVNNGVEFDEEDRKVLEKVMPLEEWGECYNKYWVDSISREWGTIGENIYVVERLVDEEQFGMDLLKINAKIFAKDPGSYFRALCDMNTLIWEISTPHDGYIWSVSDSQYNADIDYHLAYKLLNEVAKFQSGTPIGQSLAVRGGMSLFIIIFSVVLFLGSKKRFIIMLIPTIVVDAMLFITIPAQDVRYILPEMEVAIFLVAVLASGGLMRAKNSESEEVEVE